MAQAGAPPDPPAAKRLAIGDLIVDVGQVRVTRDGRSVPLPGLSFDLLVALARAAPDVLSHDELMARVWKGVVVSPETVAQRVKLLRDALGDDPREARYVVGVRGRGYRLAARVTALPDEPASPAAAVTAVPADSTATATASAPAPADPRAIAPAPRRWPWLAAAAVAVAVTVAVVALAPRPAWLSPRTPIVAPPSAPADPAARSVEVVGLPPRTVAVLPFDNLTADRANDFIGLGIAEMVLNRLAGSETLFVVARSSSFAFAGRNVDAREIGRRLGAKYLVQGSVQRSGDRVRVLAQLVDADTGRQRSSLQLDRTLDDLFALQDEIATKLAAELATPVGRPLARSANLDAQLEYLRGLEANGRWRVAESERAIGHFRRARELDPAMAVAYVGEAEAIWRRAFLLTGGQRADAERDRVLPLVERALAIDPELGAAYVLRANYAADPAAAERDRRRAIALSPSDANAHEQLATLLFARGGAEAEAWQLLERAIVLDPLQPRLRYVYAMSKQADGDVVAFERRLLEVLQIDPDYTQALTRLAQIELYQRGRFAEAVARIERSLATDPRSAWARLAAFEAYLAIGDPAAAADVVADAPAVSLPRIALAVHAGDLRGAAALASTPVPGPDGREAHVTAIGSLLQLPLVLALRDAAIRSGDPTRVLRLLREEHCRVPGAQAPVPHCIGPGMLAAASVIADLEAASGDRAAGEAQARRVLEAVSGTRGPGRFAPRPMLVRSLLQLGRTDEALRELAAIQATAPLVAWWVFLKRDPVFDPVRGDPRFRAVLAEARRHAAAERATLDAMRRHGRVPRRPAG